MGSIIKSPLVEELYALQSPFLTSINNGQHRAVNVEFSHPENPPELTSDENNRPILGSSPTLDAPAEEPVVSAEDTAMKLLALEEKAHNKGFDLGYKQGQELAKNELNESLKFLADLIQAGQVTLGHQLEGLNSLIVSIVFEAVCKIIGETLTTPESCKDIISYLIKSISEEDLVTIKVSLRDMEKLTEIEMEASPTFPFDKLEADAAVELGGCIIKLKQGTIDARIETQLSNFADTLRNLLKS